MHRAGRGFTLVELASVLAAAAILAAVALPAWRGHELRIARLDAVDALTRLQSEEEKHRALHGLYAGDLATLRGVALRSRQGRYALDIEITGTEAYRATARAVGTQLGDTECPALTLDVSLGFASPGPNPRCWNR